MTKRNLFLLFSTLLNVLLIFILVEGVRNPIIKETSDKQNIDSAQNSTVEKSGEVIGEEAEEQGGLVKVTKVIDGDTIRLESGEVVRYIGIDTPEVSGGQECFASESTVKNTELVLGKKVHLEKDVSERDRYNRILRYVWVSSETGQDRVFVNEFLVREGYATAVTYPPDVKYSQLFRDAEKDARENNRELWGKCQGKTSEVSEAPKESIEGVGQIGSGGNWNCSSNTYNCTDFRTQLEAQNAFDSCGGIGNDVHKLDADKDGRVCESLP